MGCLVSKHLTAGDHHNNKSSSHDDGHPEQSPHNDGSMPHRPSARRPSVQYNRAIDRVYESNASQTITIGETLTVTYAFVSQRGRYPDEPFKANQDALCVHPVLTSPERGDALFCVMDGHGKDGDGCARFCQDHLPESIRTAISQATDDNPNTIIPKDQLLKALTEAHVQTNQALHAETTIDDSLSGTTAVSLYFHGKHNRLTVTNVGDSRAVLGSRPVAVDASASGRKLKALPLSRDQTPYRRDEKARIQETGARVLSLDQLEGLEPIPDPNATGTELVLGDQLDEGGDPPRVWHPTQEYPGTAFTRSIGDALAEELGVYAEPEMLTRQMQPTDAILVIASDGVYEFLTNQSVIDICAKFTDPLEACRAVVAEAYELWLQYELRTDDITIICMFIDQVEKPKVKAAAPQRTLQHQNSNDNLVVVGEEELKPVRKNMSKEKQKEIEKLQAQSSAAASTPDEPVDLTQLATPKTASEKAAIADAIKASVMFRNISETQRELVYSCMESIPVSAGTWVIRQGEVGDRFYIVDDGTFEVRILPDGEDDVNNTGGNIVHHYHGSRERHQHPSFGDLALMHSAPRSASIVAQTHGHLWALHRAAFRQILMAGDGDRSDAERVLRNKVLAHVPGPQPLGLAVSTAVACLEPVTISAGQNVVFQGQKADAVYILRSGSAYSTAVTSDGATERCQLKAKSVIGTFTEQVHPATVMTMQECKCWKLTLEGLAAAGLDTKGWIAPSK